MERSEVNNENEEYIYFTNVMLFKELCITLNLKVIIIRYDSSYMITSLLIIYLI